MAQGLRSTLLLVCFCVLQWTSAVLASPLERAVKCTKPGIRREWRTLSSKDKLDYLNAVTCLTKKPAKSSPSFAPGAKTRYDDFVAVHINQTMKIHFVGQFLPWHRYFGLTFENALRNECGYKGQLPYWDWTQDVATQATFLKAPVFDPKYGFGGNGPYIPTDPNDPKYVPGRTGGGCVTNGPFKNLQVHLGPGEHLNYNASCLKRDFSPYMATHFLGKNNTDVILAQTYFGGFERILEGFNNFVEAGPHAGGHFAVGGLLGQFGDIFSSPADPIFFLHHANLDRIWWSWEKKDLTNRLKDISGPVNFNDWGNKVGGNTTLGYSFNLGVNAPTVTVGDMMSLQGPVACYQYDRLAY